jgi:AcrR family transcriptional regulator
VVTGEQQWPFRRHPRWYGRVSESGARAERLATQIQRHKEQVKQPQGRDRRLSREEIVRAAIVVGDAEGAGAISMRRIARELHAGVMSLYWHVGSKEELIDAMRESIEAEVETLDPSGDWRADLQALARGQRNGLLKHPWMMDFLTSGPLNGQNADNVERVLAVFDPLGLSPAVTLNLVMTLTQYVVGAALGDIREIRAEETKELADAELSQAELEDEQARVKEYLGFSGRYPHLIHFIVADIDRDGPNTREDRFEFGLGIVLDGIAAQLRLGHALRW